MPIRGARDAAVVALAYDAGLRREEIANLSLDGFDATGGTVRVLGKGDEERLAHLAAGGAEWKRGTTGIRAPRWLPKMRSSST